MKEMLNIYYNITNCSICVRGTKTSIKSNNEEYELIEIYNKERIRNINSLLHQKKLESFFYKIILNNANEFVTDYKNKHYCLIKKSVQNKIKKIMYPQKITIDESMRKTYEKNWKELWINKINWLKEICKNNTFEFPKEIIELTDYYIGMSELALQLLKQSEYANEYGSVQLYMMQIRQSNERENPINIVIDRKERHYAEKIKRNIFSKKFDINREAELISKEKLNKKILLSRLLFPTYFFDIIEKYIANDFWNEELHNIKENVDEYESLVFHLISK